MRFKPGTTNEEAKAKLAAFAEKQRNRDSLPINQKPSGGGALSSLSPNERPLVLPPRPSTQPVRPGVSPPQQPNVMGFPDMDPRLQQFAERLNQEAMQQMFGRPTSMPPTQGPRVQQAVNMERGLTMGPKPGGTFQADLGRPDMPVLRGNDGNGNPMGVATNRPMVDSQGRPPPQTVRQVTPIEVPANVTNIYTPGGRGSAPMGRPSGPINTGGLGQGGIPSYMSTSQSDIMGGDRRPTGGFNLAGMRQGLQQLAVRNNPQAARPGAPAFKKGGKVAVKAPVKKAAGGKVAAKAPVKKAMGGPIKAKPAAKPAAKMAKPMPAMKRGGKVMAKGRKK